MSKQRRNRQTEEILDPTAGLSEADLDEMERDPGFHAMADAVDRADHDGVPYIPHEQVLKENGYRPRKDSRSKNPSAARRRH